MPMKPCYGIASGEKEGLQGLHAETLRWEELRTLAPPQATVHSKLLGEELRPLTPPLAGLGLANGAARGARLPRL
jgi:hypothetical protein